MLRAHEANKSILFAKIFDPYEVTQREFAQIKDDLFAHVYKALDTVDLCGTKFVAFWLWKAQSDWENILKMRKKPHPLINAV